MPRVTPLTTSTARRFPCSGVIQLIGLLLLSVSLASSAQAASPLLESVKQNPALAKQMCTRFKQLNAEGISATSKQAITAVAAAQGLSPMDAEVLITYVIGLNCPDVR